MKTTVFLMILLLCATHAGAQNTNPNTKKKQAMPCDTIAAGGLCLEPDVVQFSVTIISGGIILRQNTIRGCCYQEFQSVLRSGMIVICEEIVAAPEPGLLVKRPAKKFYIR